MKSSEKGIANFKVRNLEEKEFPIRIKKKERA